MLFRSDWLQSQRALLTSGKLPNKFPEELKAILQRPQDQLTEAQQQALRSFWVRQQKDLKPLAARLDDHLKTRPAKPELTVRVLLQRTQSPRQTFVLHRGEFLNPLTELEVVPAAPAILPALTARTAAAAPDRLDFARWLVSGENPLPPRVTVNHIWARLFGRGLVRTLGDFGVRGEAPSHPELLDWLANRFLQDGQSLKSLHRMLLLSSAWQQSAKQRDAALTVDADNRLLWRMNRRRLTAEELRDAVLSVSGSLDAKMGGPGFYLFALEKTDHSPHYEYHKFDPADPQSHRRSIYRFIVRSQPDPFMTTLD